MRLQGNSSAGNSAGHSIEISIIYRLSKRVPLSLITLIKMLTFWPRSAPDPDIGWIHIVGRGLEPEPFSG